jgi:hypothetical protein
MSDPKATNDPRKESLFFWTECARHESLLFISTTFIRITQWSGSWRSRQEPEKGFDMITLSDQYDHPDL